MYFIKNYLKIGLFYWKLLLINLTYNYKIIFDVYSIKLQGYKQYKFIIFTLNFRC